MVPQSLQESKAVEQDGEQAPNETQSPDTQQEDPQTPDTPDLILTPEVQDDTPVEPPTPEAPPEYVTPQPPPPVVVQQPEEPQPVNPDRQSRVYTLPDSYRGIGGELCPGYGSLSRATLHGYWPAKNFQTGAHCTLPFLRDSYAPAALSSQAEEEGGENPLDLKAEHPGSSYPTLAGVHQFRPITTMELLREPSRTR